MRFGTFDLNTNDITLRQQIFSYYNAYFRCYKVKNRCKKKKKKKS